MSHTSHIRDSDCRQRFLVDVRYVKLCFLPPLRYVLTYDYGTGRMGEHVSSAAFLMYPPCSVESPLSVLDEQVIDY